jgi:hypothetical protein
LRTVNEARGGSVSWRFHLPPQAMRIGAQAEPAGKVRPPGIVCGRHGRSCEVEGRLFFFEKKNQKTFVRSGTHVAGVPVSR